MAAHAQGEPVVVADAGHERSLPAAEVAAPERDKRARRIGGAIGDDVDHPGHGIRAIQRCRRAEQDFHLFGRIQREILRNREIAARRVTDAHAIEHDQNLVAAVVALHRKVVVGR